MALFSPGLSRPRDHMSPYLSPLYLLSKPQINLIPLDITLRIFLNAYCSGCLLRTPVSPFSTSLCQRDRAYAPQQQLPCLPSMVLFLLGYRVPQAAIIPLPKIPAPLKWPSSPGLSNYSVPNPCKHRWEQVPPLILALV